MCNLMIIKTMRNFYLFTATKFDILLFNVILIFRFFLEVLINECKSLETLKEFVFCPSVIELRPDRGPDKGPDKGPDQGSGIGG